MTGDARFRYLIGIDPDTDLAAREVAAFDRFYDSVHVREVVAANPGFVSGHRLEAIRQTSGHRPVPRWLAMYAIADLAAVRDYISRQQVAGAGISYTPGPVPWSRMTTIWRAILTLAGGPCDVTQGPDPVLLTGYQPDPAGDEFAGQARRRYLEDVVPGTAARLGATGATTFQVHTELGGRSPVPRMLTAYAGPAAAAAGLGQRITWSRPYRRTGIP